MTKKVLITGGNGFVGSHLIERLLTEDVEIVATLRAHTSDMNKVKHIKDKRLTFEICDLVDYQSIQHLFEIYEPFDEIYHLAAQSYVPKSYTSPAVTIQTNIIGTINLFEVIRFYSPNARILNVSSSEVYGHQVHIPTIEEEPFFPLSVYALSKCGQDYLGKMYASLYDMFIVTTRAFTHTGARRGNVFFESAFAKQIAKIELGLQEPVIKVGNMDSNRTIMNVKDCIEAYIGLCRFGNSGESYNIGGEETWTVKEVLQYLMNMSTFDKYQIVIKVEKELLRPKDVNMQVPDLTKLKKTLPNWKPKYTVTNTLDELLNYWREELK